MKKILSILTVGCALTLSSCEDWLDKYPLAQMSPETFFSNENELQAFSNTFYTIFPGDGLYNEGYDNIVKNEIAAEMRDGRTIPASGGGWTWTDLRKFNTLLEYSGNCKDTDIRNRYDLNILEIRRITVPQSRFFKTISQRTAPNTVLLPDDLLYVMGDFDKVQHFAETYRLELLDTHMPEERSAINRNSLDFYDIGIAEIVLMPTSGLINRTIGESGFRDKYHVNILGIRRKREYILNNMKDEKMHSGDVLLVQGSWNAIGHFSQENSDWVVLGQPLNEAAKVTLDYKAPLAGVIMLLMIMAMVFDFIPIAPVTAIMIAAVLMVLTGCFRNVEAAYKTINWESIVLIAAMLPMSMALEKTGVSEYISNSLVSGLGVYGPIALLAGIYFTTSLLTMFISNTATAVLLAPIALQSAIQIGTSPYPFLFAVTVGASMCFASPFSTPPNALVMPAGQYTFMDYVKVGLPLQIIMGIVMIFVLPGTGRSSLVRSEQPASLQRIAFITY